MIARGFQAMVLPLAVANCHPRLGLHLVQDFRQVDALRLPVAHRSGHVEPVDAPDHLGDGMKTHRRHDLAQFLGNEEEIVDDMLRRAGEALAQNRVLRRNADRTGVEMALAHHQAARGNQRRRGKAEFVRAQKRRDCDIAPGAHSAVHLHGNAPAKSVEHQGLLGFRQADFPRAPGMGGRGQRRRPGAAVETRNRHMIGSAFGDARRHRAHADFGHQLHRNARFGVDALQVADELRQILDGVDIVMRRRRDQSHARRRMAHPGDVLVHLGAGQLPAFAGLGPLCHLDLDIVGIDQIFRRHAEASRRHLYDGRAYRIAIGERLEAVGFLPALAGIGARADAIHGNRQVGMCLAGD